jgi:hypothetical protein
MMDQWTPRLLVSVVVEAGPDQLVATFDLGEPAPMEEREFSGYGVDYYGPDGNGGKQLGVRHSVAEGWSAHIFEWESATQANYTADAVDVSQAAVIVRYRDATLGLDEVGTVIAFSHVDGDDVQSDVPVTLLT